LTCTGDGKDGKLGNGSPQSQLCPVKVQINESVKQISVVGDRNFAVTQSGQLWCWGANLEFKLGVDDTTPNFPKTTPHMIKNPLRVQVPDSASVKEVYSGLNFTLVVSEDGKLYGFGSNKAKILASLSYSYLPTPSELTKLSELGYDNIVKDGCSLNEGNNMVVANTSDGKTIAWGVDDVALDDFEDIEEPIDIPVLKGLTVECFAIFKGEGYIIGK